MRIRLFRYKSTLINLVTHSKTIIIQGKIIRKCNFNKINWHKQKYYPFGSILTTKLRQNDLRVPFLDGLT